MRHYTPYQKKVIQRYYEHQPNLQLQQLSELVTDLYLADEGKQARLWKKANTLLEKMKVPRSRIDHVIQKADPALLAGLVKELDAASGPGGYLYRRQKIFLIRENECFHSRPSLCFHV